MTRKSAPRPFVGLAAGLVAGLAASATMAAFQSVAGKFVDSGDDDPATVQAADKASVVATGTEVPEPWRERAGQIVHYVTGGSLGAMYGLLAEYRPGVTKGFGSAFGAVTSLILDEAAVPAAGLGPKPSQTSAGVHAYGLAAHLVFGVTLEGVRALVAGRRI